LDGPLNVRRVAFFFLLATSTNLRPACRKEDSSSAWTLATLMRPGDGEVMGAGEPTGEGGGEGGSAGVGGNSW